MRKLIRICAKIVLKRLRLLILLKILNQFSRRNILCNTIKSVINQRLPLNKLSRLHSFMTRITVQWLQRHISLNIRHPFTSTITTKPLSILLIILLNILIQYLNNMIFRERQKFLNLNILKSFLTLIFFCYLNHLFTILLKFIH